MISTQPTPGVGFMRPQNLIAATTRRERCAAMAGAARPLHWLGTTNNPNRWGETMRWLPTFVFAALIALVTSELSNGQSPRAVGPQGSLRSRLPFSGPTDSNAARMGSNQMRQAGGAVGFSNNYAGWAGYGYPGMGATAAQAYYNGREPIAPTQRAATGNVAGNISNYSQAPFAGQQAFDEGYSWMDFEPMRQATQPDWSGYSPDATRSNNTANATNAQGYTGAVVPGADQVPAAVDDIEPSAQSVNTTQGFYQRPLMERMPQMQQSRAPAAGESTQAQGQQPSGVSEAASSGPIKY